MEVLVLETQPKINLATQMVAPWIANGGSGQNGTHAQQHVVGELRQPGGE